MSRRLPWMVLIVLVAGGCGERRAPAMLEPADPAPVGWSTPLEPVVEAGFAEVEELAAGGLGLDVVARGEHAWVATGRGVVLLRDAGDALAVVEQYATPGWAQALAWWGDDVVVADGPRGVRLVRPGEGIVAALEPGGDIVDVAVVDDVPVALDQDGRALLLGRDDAGLALRGEAVLDGTPRHLSPEVGGFTVAGTGIGLERFTLEGEAPTSVARDARQDWERAWWIDGQRWVANGYVRLARATWRPPATIETEDLSGTGTWVRDLVAWDGTHWAAARKSGVWRELDGRMVHVPIPGEPPAYEGALALAAADDRLWVTLWPAGVARLRDGAWARWVPEPVGVIHAAFEEGGRAWCAAEVFDRRSRLVALDTGASTALHQGVVQGLCRTDDGLRLALGPGGLGRLRVDPAGVPVLETDRAAGDVCDLAVQDDVTVILDTELGLVRRDAGGAAGTPTPVLDEPVRHTRGVALDTTEDGVFAVLRWSSSAQVLGEDGVRAIHLQADPADVLVIDGRAYVAEPRLGFEVFDLTADVWPPPRTQVPLRPGPGRLAATPDGLIACVGQHGLVRYRLDGDGLPQVVGAIDTPGDAQAIETAADGSYLVADTTSVLRVWLSD